MKILKNNTISVTFFLLGMLFILLQKPEYVTSTIIKLDSIGGEAIEPTPFFPMASNDENNLLEKIALSKSVIFKLAKALPISEHFQEVPSLRRGFKQFENDDEFFHFMQSYLKAQYNEDTSTTKITFNAYDPDTSYLAVKKLITIISFEINRINQEKLNAQLSPTQAQIERAKEAVKLATDHLSGFEVANNFTSPETILEGRISSLLEVQKAIHEKESKIEQLLTYLKSTSQEVILAKKQLEALKETANKIGKDTLTDERVQSLLQRHEILKSEKEAAVASLKAAKLKYEQINFDLLKKQQFLSLITMPVKPVVAEEPVIMKSMILLLILSFLVQVLETAFRRQQLHIKSI